MLKILVLALSICSCSKSDKPQIAVPHNTEIQNQGVRIDYTDSKVGDTVLLFLHGWGIDQTYWADQVAHFAPRYRVVTVDLPGFGKSGKNRNSWTVEDYARDVAAVLSGLDLKDVVLVGHSMSGAIVVETALMHPSRVLGVVGIDNLKDIDFELTPEIESEWAAYYDTMRVHFRETVSEGIQQLFSDSTDTLVRNRVTADILSSDSTIAVDCLENLDKYPFAEKLKSLKKPLYLINSSYMPTDTLAFPKSNVECHHLDMGPTGHYPMIEAPEKFNELLQQAMDGMGRK
ncbi:MAG: alpha/beta hydrolase [Bacteroidia bacterium]